MTNPNPDCQKRAAAAAALDFVRPGMRIGLGTGSTASHFVDLLGVRVRAGMKAVCTPTSEATARQAQSLGIELATLDELEELDVTVDGADEFDSALRLVKGGGGALLREKIVASASRRMVVIADASKQVATLGAFPLPIEVDRFAAQSTRRHIERAARDLGLEGPIRQRLRAGAPFVTDGGHYIFDASLGAITAPESFAARLNAIPGVVEHGLFIGIATTVLVANADGVVTLGEAAE
jgi:ribose 5-phosphate isomerase A